MSAPDKERLADRGMMKIEKFVIGVLGTNCYLVRNEESRECFLIDPAICPQNLVEHIRQEGLDMKAILLTHGHFDHIMGLHGFLDEFSVPVYACAAEERLLNDASMNASAQFAVAYTFSGADYVEDGQVLSLAGMTIQVLHTPGHTIGCCCYYLPEEGVLFSGDTLFCGSTGRTDFPTGSQSQLVRSIREKLLPLPDETKVYPGHMSETTIGFEKQHNPFL